MDWRRVALPPDVSAHGWMYDVAAGPAGLVAVGETRFGSVATWFSPDGVTWTPGTYLERPDGDRFEYAPTGRFGPQWLGDSNAMVVATADGFVLLDSGRDAWVSADGRTFTPLARGDTGFGTAVTGLIAGDLADVARDGAQLVAVATSGPAEWPPRSTPPILFRSSDGRAWTPQRLAGPAFPAGDTIRAVTVVAAKGDTVLLAAHEFPLEQAGKVRLLAWEVAAGGRTTREVLASHGWPEPLDAIVAGGRRVVVGVELERALDGGTRVDVGGDPVAWVRDAGGWDRIVLPRAGEGSALSVPEAVIAAGDGLLAVGWEGTRDGSRAVAWRSDDGRSWIPTRLEGPVAELPGGVPHPGDVARAVTTFGDGLVAVGSDADGAAVWVSGTFPVPQGATEPAAAIELDSSPGWTAAGSGPATDGAVVDDVIAFGDGFVAVGRSPGETHRGDPPGAIRPTIWRSPDGRRWTRLPATGIPPAGRPPALRSAEPQWFRIAAADGGLVILEAGRHAWVSTDGEQWTAVDWKASGLRPPLDLEGSRDTLWPTTIHDVAGGPDGLVAVGRGCFCHAYSTGDSSATAWTSGTGDTWRVAPFRDASLGGVAQTEMREVVAFRGGWVALGWRLRGGNDDAVAWWSADGRAWTRVAWAGRPDEEPGGLATDGAQVVAAIASGSGAVVRITRDGRTWSAPVTLPGAGRPASVAIDERGIVVAGVVERSMWDGSLVVWRSVDGSTWTREDISTDFKVERSIGGLVLTADRIVVLGGEGSDAGIWSGPR